MFKVQFLTTVKLNVKIASGEKVYKTYKSACFYSLDKAYVYDKLPYCDLFFSNGDVAEGVLIEQDIPVSQKYLRFSGSKKNIITVEVEEETTPALVLEEMPIPATTITPISNEIEADIPMIVELPTICVPPS